MKIGITITTRQRAHVLDLCLSYYALYLPKCDYEFWVIHDANSETDDSDYLEMLKKYPFVRYHRNSERLGIAKSKTECLRKVQDCDYIFLNDDDIMPIREDWIDFFIGHSTRTGINHFLYQIDLPFLAKIGENNGIGVYGQCGGIMLFLTQEVIKKVGAFETRYAAPYSYEHANYSMRINQAGLNNGYGQYLSPLGVNEVMFSLDYDMNNWGLRPPFHPDLVRDTFTSSVAGEEHLIPGWCGENARYLYPSKIYEPF